MIHRVLSSTRVATVSVLLLGMAVGCANNPHQAEIAELQGLRDSLEAAKADLVQLPADTLNATLTWATDEFRNFEVMMRDTGMVLTKDEGLIVAEVSRARRLLKDFPERRTRIGEAIDRALNQTAGLAQLLTEQQATDGAGNTVDSAYIADNLRLELRIGRDLCASVAETADYAERGQATAEAVREQADSLATVLRARLAQLVLARANDSETAPR
jgi:hypothetical protein